VQPAEYNLIVVMIFNKNHTALAYTDSKGTLGQSKALLIKLELTKKKNLVSSQQTVRKPK